MKRNLASALALGASAAAAIAAAALGPGKAYADDITIETTLFVSTRSRTEVKAELMGQRATVTAAGSEWTLQHNEVPHLTSGYTTQQARADFIASRREVSALTGEDSGSMYLARMGKPVGRGDTVVAGISDR
ncbi:MAG: hypothetical protein ABI409_01800 [Ramlibacter sp.]